MTILSGVKKFLGFEGVGETALKIVERISGTDWTPQQRADFILNYHQVTKHMSVARRFIAIAFTVGLAMYSFAYLSTLISYHVYVFFATTGDTLAEVTRTQNLAEIKAKPLLQLSNSIYAYLRDVFTEPMTWILSFYFAIDVANKFKSKKD